MNDELFENLKMAEEIVDKAFEEKKELKQPTIIGTPKQIRAIKSLISRCKVDIPEDALSGLTVKFGIPERLFRPGEKPSALYSSEEKIIYLKPDSTEYDFFHELSHRLDHVAGLSIYRHAAADRFMRKWGIPKKRIVKD